MDVIFVDGIPTKSSAERLMYCTKVIFTIQLVYFIYRMLTVHEHWIHYIIGFVICGVYIPLCGYQSAQQMNRRHLSLFTGTQCFFSFIALFDIMNYTLDLYLLQDACEQCAEEFSTSKKCILEYSEEADVTIWVEQCTALPSLAQIVVYMVFMSCIAFSGCWAALVARSVGTEKIVDAYLVQHVPDVEEHRVENEEVQIISHVLCPRVENEEVQIVPHVLETIIEEDYVENEEVINEVVEYPVY